MAAKQELKTDQTAPIRTLAEAANGPYTAPNGLSEYQQHLILVPETISRKDLDNFVKQTTQAARQLIREAKFDGLDENGEVKKTIFKAGGKRNSSGIENDPLNNYRAHITSEAVPGKLVDYQKLALEAAHVNLRNIGVNMLRGVWQHYGLDFDELVSKAESQEALEEHFGNLRSRSPKEARRFMENVDRVEMRNFLTGAQEVSRDTLAKSAEFTYQLEKQAKQLKKSEPEVLSTFDQHLELLGLSKRVALNSSSDVFGRALESVQEYDYSIANGIDQANRVDYGETLIESESEQKNGVIAYARGHARELVTLGAALGSVAAAYGVSRAEGKFSFNPSIAEATGPSTPTARGGNGNQPETPPGRDPNREPGDPGNGNGNGPEHPDKPDHPDHPDHPDKPEHPEKPEKPDHPDHPDKPEHPDHPDKPGKPDKTPTVVGTLTPTVTPTPALLEHIICVDPANDENPNWVDFTKVTWSTDGQKVTFSEYLTGDPSGPNTELKTDTGHVIVFVNSQTRLAEYYAYAFGGPHTDDVGVQVRKFSQPKSGFDQDSNTIPNQGAKNDEIIYEAGAEAVVVNGTKLSYSIPKFIFDLINAGREMWPWTTEGTGRGNEVKKDNGIQAFNKDHCGVDQPPIPPTQTATPRGEQPPAPPDEKGPAPEVKLPVELPKPPIVEIRPGPPVELMPPAPTGSKGSMIEFSEEIGEPLLEKERTVSVEFIREVGNDREVILSSNMTEAPYQKGVITYSKGQQYKLETYAVPRNGDFGQATIDGIDIRQRPIHLDIYGFGPVDTAYQLKKVQVGDKAIETKGDGSRLELEVVGVYPSINPNVETYGDRIVYYTCETPNQDLDDVLRYAVVTRPFIQSFDTETSQVEQREERLLLAELEKLAEARKLAQGLELKASEAEPKEVGKTSTIRNAFLAGILAATLGSAILYEKMRRRKSSSRGK